MDSLVIKSTSQKLQYINTWIVDHYRGPELTSSKVISMA